ncbi:MAG: CopG family ribbon-helix-helix protein [Thermoplasmata archaeon]|nr:CopG family ribbon-helix-helix protein [Thermoplasmata archaeon]
MPIVSVSLGDEDVENLDRIQEQFGLKGRSDAVRTAIRQSTANLQDIQDLKGQVEGVLIAVRRDHADPWLSNIQAAHMGLVTTQLHSHLRDHKCLEVMILSGSAAEVKRMILDIEASNKAEYVRFVRQ